MSTYAVTRVGVISSTWMSTAVSQPGCGSMRFLRPTRPPAAVRSAVELLGPGQQSPGDDHALDLVRPLADHHERSITVVALDRKVGRVAHAAVDAHGFGGELEGRLTGEELGHARFDVAAEPGHPALSRVLREQPGRLEPCR